MERLWRKYSKAWKHLQGSRLKSPLNMSTRCCWRKIAIHASSARSITKICWQMRFSLHRRKGSSASEAQQRKRLPQRSHQIQLFFLRLAINNVPKIRMLHWVILPFASYLHLFRCLAHQTTLRYRDEGEATEAYQALLMSWLCVESIKIPTKLCILIVRVIWAKYLTGESRGFTT